MSVYGSKYAPRPCFSNVLSFRSFEYFLISLRAELWTLSLRKKITKYEWRWTFSKFHQWKKNCQKLHFFFASFFTLLRVLRLKIVIRLLQVFVVRKFSKPMLRQLGNSLHGSKDAPRPPFSHALQFISFGSLLMTLRAHFVDSCFDKKWQNTRACELFFKTKNLICYHFWSSVE